MSGHFPLHFGVASLMLPLAGAVAASSPLAVRMTFSATVEQHWVEHTAGARPPTRTTFTIAASQELLAVRQSTPLSDGRRGVELMVYGEGHRYHVQPFFHEEVCFEFDLQSPQGLNASAFWRDDVQHAMGVYDEVLSTAKMEGNATVLGRVVTSWFYSVGSLPDTVVAYRLYVDADGALLAVNLTESYAGYVAVTTTFFHEYNPDPPSSAFARENLSEGKCVDLTNGKDASLDDPVNDGSRIATANSEAAGHWHAGASTVFEGLTLRAAGPRLGADVRPLRLPLAAQGEAHGGNLSASSAPPPAFDARERWEHCESIGRIRNQGDCGSCWAFAANEVLADRLCIGGGETNFTGSVEYMINCDKQDSACDGGLLDDAWEFLQRTGVPPEACDPYSHCPRPELEKCHRETGGLSSPVSCPAVCKNGDAMRKTQANTAYAVAAPGNVAVMQREILTKGPIEVAFFVFSDFLTYSNGTYFRTPSATGPQGGHAVRILGWGVDDMGTDYWLVANSWSSAWGERGFFRIRRGTNECGIETTPVAGDVGDAASGAHSSPRDSTVLV